MSIILFEHLKDAKQAKDLKTEIYCSLLSAMMAREQAKKMKLPTEEGVETSFVATMFHELGKLLTIFYFPEEYQEIKNLIEHQGMDTDKAVFATLGIKYSDLGKGIAGEWKLPDVIGNSMDKLPGGKLKAATDLPQRIHQLSCFANELCALGRQDIELETAIKELAERYEDTLKINDEQIHQLIAHSKAELEEFTRVIQMDLSSINLFPDPATRSSVDEANEDVSDIPDIVSNKPNDILINGVSEITNTMLGEYDVNQILTMVLETIYRGMGFNRVLFCLKDGKNNQLVARFGYGKTISQIIPKFKFNLDNNSDDVISLSALKAKEFVILDSSNPLYTNRIPAELRKLTSPSTLVLYPLIVNKRVLGVMYADMDEQSTDLSSEVIQYFNTLRNQAALAIMQKQMK